MKHELLYDQRHAVLASNNWTLRMLFWLARARLFFSFWLRFSSLWKEKEELVTTWSFPLFSDSQFTTNREIQSYYSSNIDFNNCVSLRIQKHNQSKISLSTRFSGSTSRLILTSKNTLKKENFTLNRCESFVDFVSHVCCVSHTHTHSQ